MDALQKLEEPEARVMTPGAAKMIKSTPATMRNWRKAGVGPRYIRIVGRYWYRISDLRDFINSGVVEAKATVKE